MLRQLGEFSPLMIASFLVHASNAAITTMIGIVIAGQPGGEQSDVSLIAACYSLGFMAGCFLAPAQAIRVGLIRAYAGAAAIVTISIVGLELLDGAILWAVLRFMMGASIAALLAISDAWLNGNTSGDMRGRVIAAYSIVMGIGALVSQMIFLFVDADTDGFVLTFAVVMNFAVVLVALTSAKPPVMEVPVERRSEMLTFTSLTASVAAFVSGFTTVSIISLTPYYLIEHQVSSELVALALAVFYLGRLLFQWPIGSLSDRVDRRIVLVGLTTITALLMAAILLTEARDGMAISGALGSRMQYAVLVGTFVLGAVLFPIYSVASALAFDRANGRPMIDISKTLLVVYSIGSIVGPFVVIAVSNYFEEDDALPLCVLVACLLVIVTGLLHKIVSVKRVDPVSAAVIVPESSLEMVQAAATLVEEEATEEADRN